MGACIPAGPGWEDGVTLRGIKEEMLPDFVLVVVGKWGSQFRQLTYIWGKEDELSSACIAF